MQTIILATCCNDRIHLFDRNEESILHHTLSVPAVGLRKVWSFEGDATVLRARSEAGIEASYLDSLRESILDCLLRLEVCAGIAHGLCLLPVSSALLTSLSYRKRIRYATQYQLIPTIRPVPRKRRQNPPLIRMIPCYPNPRRILSTLQTPGGSRKRQRTDHPPRCSSHPRRSTNHDAKGHAQSVQPFHHRQHDRSRTSENRMYARKHSRRS